jgi:hypothetical protein
MSLSRFPAGVELPVVSLLVGIDFGHAISWLLSQAITRLPSPVCSTGASKEQATSERQGSPNLQTLAQFRRGSDPQNGLTPSFSPGQACGHSQDPLKSGTLERFSIAACGHFRKPGKAKFQPPNSPCGHFQNAPKSKPFKPHHPSRKSSLCALSLAAFLWLCVLLPLTAVGARYDTPSTRRRGIWLGAALAPPGVWLRYLLSRCNVRPKGSVNWLPVGTMTANVLASALGAVMALLLVSVSCSHLELVHLERKYYAAVGTRRFSKSYSPLFELRTLWLELRVLFAGIRSQMGQHNSPSHIRTG